MKNNDTFLAFTIEGQRYALSLASVEKITRAVAITPLPKAPPVVRGIINFRGRVIPVVSLRERFGLPDRNLELSDHLIMAETPARSVALTADLVEGVIEIDRSEIVEPGRVAPCTEYVGGVVKLAGGLLLIHDLATLLSLDEETALDQTLQESGSEP